MGGYTIKIVSYPKPEKMLILPFNLLDLLLKAQQSQLN